MVSSGRVLDADVFDEIYRQEVGRCVATLVRVFGDVELAEDTVAEGVVLLALMLLTEARWPARYQFQAAIVAVQADAPTAETTHWSQIVTLYDQLHHLQPGSTVTGCARRSGL